jgi:hypothetical protein
MGPRGTFVPVAANLLLLVGTMARARAADVLTQHNNNARTGANTAETVLTTRNVSPDKFGKLWTLYADGQVVAQPLYVSTLAVDVPAGPGVEAVRGTFNAVVIATMHNTVYVYDADKENRQPNGQTRPLWARWLGPPRPGDKDKIDMWSTNDPEWGIVSTPVIDPQKTTLWVTSWHSEGGAYLYRLHALSLKTGADRVPPVRIGGDPPDPHKPCAYPAGYNPCSQKQRSGLLLHDGVVYVGFGGTDNKLSADPRANPHGSLFAFDGATLQQRGFWTSTPGGGNGGIWQSGQGIAADDGGHIYFVTGNGTFSADQHGNDYANSFIKAKLGNGTFAIEDYFTPCNQKWLDEKDLDFGSAGALLIPGTTLALTGGKEGVVYLLGRNNLGKYAGAGGPGCANPNVVQAFMATELHTHGAGTTWGHIHSAPVFWKGSDGARVYVWGENDRLKAFTFAGGKFSNPQQPVKSVYQPPPGMPGGMLSVSSNGTRAGSGIVWATVPLNGDANMNRGVQGIVIAVDAQNVSRQLWTSELAGPRDRLGLFAKFVPPTVAGGKVFVATYGDKEPVRIYGGDVHPQQFPASYYVAVYGVLPTAHDDHPRPIINQEADDVSVTKAVATAPLQLDARTCAPADAGAVDCTAALGKKFGAPSLHAVIVPAGYNFAGCNLLTVTTASKDGGVATSTGIGWYAADATLADQAMTSGRFVRTGELKQVGTGQLKAGGTAILHQFVGVANCTVGPGSRDKVFKPFMQFENSPDKNIFRNWDRAQNYRVSRAAPQFDRTGDVLR